MRVSAHVGMCAWCWIGAVITKSKTYKRVVDEVVVESHYRARIACNNILLIGNLGTSCNKMARKFLSWATLWLKCYLITCHDSILHEVTNILIHQFFYYLFQMMLICAKYSLTLWSCDTDTDKIINMSTQRMSIALVLKSLQFFIANGCISKISVRI